jgi:hypothetical protein
VDGHGSSRVSTWSGSEAGRGVLVEAGQLDGACPTELFGSSRPSSTCLWERRVKENMYHYIKLLCSYVVLTCDVYQWDL